jgi:hypothetical protein
MSVVQISLKINPRFFVDCMTRVGNVCLMRMIHQKMLFLIIWLYKYIYIVIITDNRKEIPIRMRKFYLTKTTDRTRT